VPLSVIAQKFVFSCVDIHLKKYMETYIGIQQNSLNLTSDNLEILITGHFRRIDPRLKTFAFYQKKASLLKEADFRAIFIKGPKGVYINCSGIS
jgi:hypothetical protein